MTDADQELDFAEIGRKLFAQNCDFIWAAEKIDGLPPMGPPEIAFAGRSNVGKSSLLNALTGRKALARVAHTPGRTQNLNFFNLGPDPEAPLLRLVDMPGYGYAAVSKEKIANWTRLMKEFLRGRATLARVFVLIDGRHGVKDTRPRNADATRSGRPLLSDRADQARRSETVTDRKDNRRRAGGSARTSGRPSGGDFRFLAQERRSCRPARSHRPVDVSSATRRFSIRRKSARQASARTPK